MTMCEWVSVFGENQPIVINPGSSTRAGGSRKKFRSAQFDNKERVCSNTSPKAPRDVALEYVGEPLSRDLFCFCMPRLPPPLLNLSLHGKS